MCVIVLLYLCVWTQTVCYLLEGLLPLIPETHKVGTATEASISGWKSIAAASNYPLPHVMTHASPNPHTHTYTQGPELIERLFLFSALWAFGATAVADKNNDYRKKFSAAWQTAFKVCVGVLCVWVWVWSRYSFLCLYSVCSCALVCGRGLHSNVLVHAPLVLPCLCDHHTHVCSPVRVRNTHACVCPPVRVIATCRP